MGDERPVLVPQYPDSGELVEKLGDALRLAVSRTSTVTSRIECSRPIEIVATSPISPSARAIAPATSDSWPNSCGI